jgi:hypothetical protein
MKKRWVGQQQILQWFWRKTGEDLVSNRKLEQDEELVEWCRQNDCEIGSAWIQCPNEEVYTMFAMRWVA